jgi:hypothetical protein
VKNLHGKGIKDSDGPVPKAACIQQGHYIHDTLVKGMARIPDVE